MEFNLVARTMQGLEDILATELEDLGAKDIEVVNRAVLFKGDLKLMYKVNYQSRLALRVLKIIHEFDIQEQDDLYREVSTLAWEKMFSVDASMTISTQCFDSVYTHSRYASQRIKDAIVDRFRRIFNMRPNIDNDNFDIRIDLYMKNDHCILSMDSSGESLHRRGYRVDQHVAPINEVLASGIIGLSNWDTKQDFYDPMCGSGTFAIEAAYIASKTPAAYLRTKFAFEYWNDYDPNLWKYVKEDACKAIQKFDCEIFASDISTKTLIIAESNIAETNFTNDITLFRANFLESNDSNIENAHIVFNPPYGQRMELDEAIDFYKEIGDVLKNEYKGSRAWVISSNIEALKHLGLRTSKKLTLFNGPLECKLVAYDLF